MGNLALRRYTTNQLISNKFDFDEYWIPKYHEPALNTVNNVTYLQDRGRLEWWADVTLIFSDFGLGQSVETMLSFIRYAKRREWFVFTDRSGANWHVRVRNILRPERDDTVRVKRKYYLDVELLLRGYE